MQAIPFNVNSANGSLSCHHPLSSPRGELLVIARETFESGTEVIFRFELPSGHTIEARGGGRSV
jgi:hypothetical protein